MSMHARILLAGASLLCLMSAPAAALDPWAGTRAPGEQPAPNLPEKPSTPPARAAAPVSPATNGATAPAAPLGAPLSLAPPARAALTQPRIPLPLAAPAEIRRAEVATLGDPAVAPVAAPAARNPTSATPTAPVVAAARMDRAAGEALVRTLPGAALPLLPPPSVSSPYAPVSSPQQASRAPFATLAAGADAIVEEVSQPDRADPGPVANPPAPSTHAATSEAVAPTTDPQAQAPAAGEPGPMAAEQPHDASGHDAPGQADPGHDASGHDASGQAAKVPSAPGQTNAEAPATAQADATHADASQGEVQTGHGDAEAPAPAHADTAHADTARGEAQAHAGTAPAQAHDAPGKSDGHSPAPADATAHGGDHKADGKASSAPPVKALVVAPPPAMANGISPMEAVRGLQRLQDKVAAGSVEAVDGQRRLLAQIDQDFRAAPQAVWQDPRNARALVIHVLSGGNPAVLRGILAQEPLPALDERLLRGALAYVEGREEQALRLFGEIDARTLPNALGAQVAIAQAATTVRKDPAKAAQLLDLARLLMPGTLVEEAALRRQILVASQSGDTDQFGRLSRQYLDRFAHSVYAGNFRQRFAAALTRMPFIDAPDGFQRLDHLLEPLDEASRREIFLLVARSAVIQGKAKTTITAAERVLASAPPLSNDAERARLYKAAAQAVTHDGFEQAQSALAALDRDRLAPPDAALLDAALVAADLVRTAPNVADAGVASPPKISDATPTPVSAPSVPAPVGASPAGASSATAPQPPVPQSPAARPVPAVSPPSAPSQAGTAPGGTPKSAPTQATAQADPAPSAIEEQARGTLAKIDKLLKEAPR
ncbi:hypothetical protein [Roseixanthobacter glucoisosaccharinicivorans]|uniref:hypothetical protein n=1 Tax=Roseixanthobacter glucoisosaccharinicivorans TaxID=3119923 RepID=UPI00372990C1